MANISHPGDCSIGPQDVVSVADAVAGSSVLAPQVSSLAINVSADAVCDDSCGSDADDEGVPVFQFEGVEKRLVVNFCPTMCGDGQCSAECTPGSCKASLGLRAVDKNRWQEVLDEAKCTIISNTSNEFFDSFVLSESSLFVYPRKFILKTCGTTTLLLVIPKLLKFANTMGLTIESVLFSRKNFNFPAQQLSPHTHFDDEVAYLNEHFEGTHTTYGPEDGDHWFVYTGRPAAKERQPQISTSEEDRTSSIFEVMMHDLDPVVMRQFFRSESFVSSEQTTESSGIGALIPGSTIDAFMFTPCGYSMNGLNENAYWTIHITPETGHSYVSFETSFVPASFGEMLRQVVETFRPGRATVTLLAEPGSKVNKSGMGAEIFEPDVLRELGYDASSRTRAELACGQRLHFMNIASAAAVEK